MADDPEKLEQLLQKLNLLLKKQELFQGEINDLRNEIYQFKAAQKTEKPTEAIPPVVDTVNKPAEEKFEVITQPVQQKRVEPYRPEPRKVSKPLIAKEDWEKFIGENLINKIGIVITVIGVGIGAKYAIDHQLISPLTRIILGYLVGLGLLGFAIRLKAQYESFSAVLLSGAMAIMYLITFAAYSFYGLMPQVAAFAIMVLFTVFTVIAALNYNLQVIAHVGLVGAYAVPFLLSDGSGRVVILYTYMAIINTGILVISFKRNWKPLLYVAFVLTWLIYLSWYVSEYNPVKHFTLALVFLSVFFTIFYLAILSYKLIKNEKFKIDDVALQLANSFLFYGVGYGLLSDNATGENLLGVFTLVNAIIHFIVSVILYRRQLADKQLFYLVSGLVLVFITIAVPVQLDGNWVSLLWAGEAALLFWIGRTKNVSYYEVLSYPLMVLAFCSLMQDWSVDYSAYIKINAETKIIPILNVHFLSSILVIAAFGFITFLNSKPQYKEGRSPKMAPFYQIALYAVPVALLVVLYGAFAMEISSYWDQRYVDSMVEVKMERGPYTQYNEDLNIFKSIWLINYSLLFFALLAFLNSRKIKRPELGLAALLFNVFCILTFLTQGLLAISELRDSYLSQHLAQYYPRGAFYLIIRYISIAFMGLSLFACYRLTRDTLYKQNATMGFEVLFHTCVLWIASSELINWMALARSEESYKLGLSILWGLYALLLISLGIWKRKQHLRIGAIGLFAVTLLKLFFYDISDLGTIAKTIVFVSLGVLLLIISFLYNKYKHQIGNEPEP